MNPDDPTSTVNFLSSSRFIIIVAGTAGGGLFVLVLVTLVGVIFVCFCMSLKRSNSKITKKKDGECIKLS